MKSTHRSMDCHWFSLWKLVLLSLFALWCSTSYVECRWCTKLESYQTVRTIVQPSKCNQSYEESCGWFTNEQCTRYEVVDCLKQKNHTVLMYKMTTKCCPGFRLDPVNNMTCIVDPASSTSGKEKIDENGEIGTTENKTPNPPSGANDVKEATTTTSSSITNGIENVSATHRSVATGDPQSQNNEDASVDEVTHEEKDESIFLNLSSGAYTGIICAFVFLLCILVLIGLHFLKNQRRLKAKAAQDSTEMETKQKMLPFSARA